MKTHHVSLESDVVFWRMTLVRLFLTCLLPLVSPSYLGKVTAWGWVPCLSSDSPKYEMTRRIIPFHRVLVMQGFCCQVKDQACPQCEAGFLCYRLLEIKRQFCPHQAWMNFDFWSIGRMSYIPKPVLGIQRNCGDGTQSKILFYQTNKIFPGKMLLFFNIFPEGGGIINICYPFLIVSKEWLFWGGSGKKREPWPIK